MKKGWRRGGEGAGPGEAVRESLCAGGCDISPELVSGRQSTLPRPDWRTLTAPPPGPCHSPHCVTWNPHSSTRSLSQSLSPLSQPGHGAARPRSPGAAAPLGEECSAQRWRAVHCGVRNQEAAGDIFLYRRTVTAPWLFQDGGQFLQMCLYAYMLLILGKTKYSLVCRIRPSF